MWKGVGSGQGQQTPGEDVQVFMTYILISDLWTLINNNTLVIK